MCQPKKWWWGLLPLAILFALMVSMTAGPVEGDLAKRSSDVFAASGLPWAKATLAGRDAVVSGQAPTPELQKVAVAAAERAWGVRKVADTTTVVAETKPFAATATRDGNKITLAGNVPSDAVSAAVEAAAKSAFPNAQVDNQLVFGRGASAVYAPALTFGLGQLAKLTKGTVGISDSAFSIVGQAADFPAFDAVTAAVKQLPAGVTLAKSEISVPKVAPFTFSATKAAEGLSLTGYIPSEALRTPIVAAAVALTTGKVTDSLRVADGLPSGLDLGKASEFMLAQLGRLKSGIASLRDDALTITGETDDHAAFETVTNTLKGGMPGGVKLASQDIKGPAPVSPYIWSATRAPGRVTLAGNIPSETLRGPITETAKKTFSGDTVIDQMKVAFGAPGGFINAVNASLAQLGKLTTGAATITNSAIKVTGEALNRAVADQVKSGLSGAGLPAGFAADLQVSFKEPPPPPAVPVPPPAPPAPPAPPPVVAAPPAPPAPPPPVVILPPDLPKVDAVIPPAPVVAAPVVVTPPVAILPPDLPKVDAVIPPAPVVAAPAVIPPASVVAAPVVAPPPVVVVAPPVKTAAEICQIKFREILDKDSIHFATASARIREESKAVLKALADAVSACPTMTVEIQGHTDSDGSDEANLDLSNRRAMAVVVGLENLGVAKGRMTAKGYGEAQPIAPNDTPENKAKNRRIDFVVAK